ncbi:hypothetical protein [Rhodoplanes roseus]|uniref:Uncharacterized protein n=1 Tax=Rhodoplanes roseus TaxID=29409 RepID=A0A327L0W2_9BRAD|nr:hypothetical protein [Rhodoplanes roseus]RAI44710.1 hypothetical protein CH341_07795 [Rhodoplanes roseus]
MAEITKRTLIAEYILNGRRLPAGTTVDLTAGQMRSAVAAGVVHVDDALDAEVEATAAAKQEPSEAVAEPDPEKEPEKEPNLDPKRDPDKSERHTGRKHARG